MYKYKMLYVNMNMYKTCHSVNGRMTTFAGT